MPETRPNPMPETRPIVWQRNWFSKSETKLVRPIVRQRNCDIVLELSQNGVGRDAINHHLLTRCLYILVLNLDGIKRIHTPGDAVDGGQKRFASVIAGAHLGQRRPLFKDVDGNPELQGRAV
nr:hypothetical protein Itr_chr14CG13810 [Ipomoea trifida]